MWYRVPEHVPYAWRMCRALWVLILGSSDEACRALRRAAGAEAQVVAMTADATQAPELAVSSNADAIVVDARAPDAQAAVIEVRARAPEGAIVWIGDGAPESVDHALGWTDDLGDALPGAITRALIARRSPKR